MYYIALFCMTIFRLDWTVSHVSWIIPPHIVSSETWNTTEVRFCVSFQHGLFCIFRSICLCLDISLHLFSADLLSSSCDLGLFLLHPHSLLLMIKTHCNTEANGWNSFVIIVEVQHVTCYMKINICSGTGFLPLTSFSTASTPQALNQGWSRFQNTTQTATSLTCSSFILNLELKYTFWEIVLRFWHKTSFPGEHHKCTCSVREENNEMAPPIGYWKVVYLQQDLNRFNSFNIFLSCEDASLLGIYIWNVLLKYWDMELKLLH